MKIKVGCGVGGYYLCVVREKKECGWVKLVGRWELKRRRVLCKDVAEAGQGKRQGAGAGASNVRKVSGSSAAFRSIAQH